MKNLDHVSGAGAAEIGRTLKRGLGRAASVVVTIHDDGGFWRAGRFVNCVELDEVAVCFRFRAGPGPAIRNAVILLPRDLEPAWWSARDRGGDPRRALVVARNHAAALGRMMGRGMVFEYLRPVLGTDAECFAMVRDRLGPAE